MARPRRTRFAASFVAIVAAGCSHEAPPTTGPGSASGTASNVPPDVKKPASTWYVSKGSDGACWAIPQIDCSKAPPGVTCNPPAGMRVACPDPMPADGFQILSYDGKTCFLADGKTTIACPSYDAPAPPPAAALTPRAWTLTRSGGDCLAAPITSADPPPAPTKVACADYPDDATGIHEVDPGTCFPSLPPRPCKPHAHCNPPRPSPVKCP